MAVRDPRPYVCADAPASARAARLPRPRSRVSYLSVAGYFANIKEAVSTIFEGMAITFSHFVRRPFTVQYPDRVPIRVQDTLPFRYRGILAVDLEICTGCLACERACPIDCIVIEAPKDKETRQMLLKRFDIDIAKCMYCGLCSEVCPTGSIHHTSEFEGADYTLKSMLRRYVTEPVAAYKPKKGPEPDPVVAAILERGMTYVEDFAPATAAPAPAPAPAAAAKPAAAAVAAAPAATATPAAAPPTTDD